MPLEFHRNYDLLTDSFEWHLGTGNDGVDDILAAQSRIERLLPLAKDGDTDRLAAHTKGVVSLFERLASLSGDKDASLRRLSRFGSISTNRGRQKDWKDDPDTGLNGCRVLKDLLGDLESTRLSILKTARWSALYPLLEDLRRFVLDYAESRKLGGRAEFHDLLIWARDLLRDDTSVRDHFRDRYRYILIDEFQDTDPIQAEIAFFLASGNDGSSTAESSISPGKLFMVGDPKQSIYRFRRADIEAVGRVRERLSEGVVPLTQNFRCQSPIIRWVNSIFERWLGDIEPPAQAPYQALDAWWSPPEVDPPLGVHWLSEVCGDVNTMRREEAQAIARVLRHIKGGRWQVRDALDGTLRDANYGDVCILMPNRRLLRDLETELDEAGVPYRIESQSMVLQSQDVRELIDCLRAIDSPADQIALVAALRSSAFACSDVDLLRFVESSGNLSYVDPGSGDGPVAKALGVLASFHRERMWQAPGPLIERFIRDRRMIELSFARRRPRERWRRLRFVVERARAFAEAGGGALRDFLDWIERQAESGARMVEASVPETDEDAVRVMTIHAAKGLEFPVVIMVGLGEGANRRPMPVIFDPSKDGRAEARLPGSGEAPLETEGYPLAHERNNEAEEAERVRLMYVAATRAKDHLIVSLFRAGTTQGTPAERILQLAEEAPGLWREISDLDPVPPAVSDTVRPEPTDTAADRDRWVREREKVIRRASEAASVAATQLAGVAKDEVTSAEGFGHRGRAGTSIGRAVHGTLQTVDLETGRGISRLSRVQAEAEGVPGHAAEVERLARRAIESEIVRRAVASGRFYREVFVTAPVGVKILEGYVDLLFEEDGEMVIVDYKTDALAPGEDTKLTRERHRTQIGAYALALSGSTGKRIKEAVLLYLHREDVTESLTDIGALMASAERLVRPTT